MKVNKRSYWNFFVLLLLDLMLPLSVSAKVVTQPEALKIANSFFYKSKIKQLFSGSLEFAFDSNDIDSVIHSDDIQAPAFYVFVPQDSKGFVIVSGDNGITPIIGYSFEDPMPGLKDIPVFMKQWLENVTLTVNELRSSNLFRSIQLIKFWKNPKPEPVVKQLKTAKWGQGYPYNDQCPEINGKKCVTGCVVTAAAIAMYYNRHPERSKGHVLTYISAMDNVKVLVDSRNLDHPIEWDKMKMEYEYGTIYSQEEVDAIAALMADIGAGLKADYNIDATECYISSIPNLAYYSYGYAPATVLIKSDYRYSEWKSFIKEDIDNGHPIIYGIYNPEGIGHAFILDGYTENNYYHFNWGWGGYGNGYYSLNLMTSNNSFINRQKLIKDFKPGEGMPITQKHWIKIMQGLVPLNNVKDIRQGEPFKIDTLAFLNTGSFTYIGKIAIAMTDSAGCIKDTLFSFYNENISPYWYHALLRCNLVINVPIKPGDRIRCLYKEKDSQEWKLVRPANPDDPYEIILKAPEMPSEEKQEPLIRSRNKRKRNSKVKK